MKKGKFLTLILSAVLVMGAVGTLPSYAAETEEKKQSYNVYGFNAPAVDTTVWNATGVTTSGVVENNVYDIKPSGDTGAFMPLTGKFSAPYTIEFDAEIAAKEKVGITFGVNGTFESFKSSVIFSKEHDCVQLFNPVEIPKAVSNGGPDVAYVDGINKCKIVVDEQGYVFLSLNGKLIAGANEFSTFISKTEKAEGKKGELSDRLEDIEIGIISSWGGNNIILHDFKVSKGIDGTGDVIFADNMTSNNLMGGAINSATPNGLNKWSLVSGQVVVNKQPDKGFAEIAKDGKLLNKTAVVAASNLNVFHLDFAINAAKAGFGVKLGAKADGTGGSELLFGDTLSISGAGSGTAVPLTDFYGKQHHIRLTANLDGSLSVYELKPTVTTQFNENKTLLATFTGFTHDGHWGFFNKGTDPAKLFAAQMIVNKDAIIVPSQINLTEVSSKFYVGSNVDVTPKIKDEYDPAPVVSISIKDDADTVVATTPTFTPTVPGAYTVSYTVTNKYEKVATATKTIYVLAKETLQSFSTDFVKGDGLTLVGGTTGTGLKLTAGEKAASMEVNGIVKNFIFRATIDGAVGANGLDLVFGRIAAGKEYRIHIAKDGTLTATGLTTTTAKISEKVMNEGGEIQLIVTGETAELAVRAVSDPLGKLNQSDATFVGAILSGKIAIEVPATEAPAVEASVLKLKFMQITNTGMFEDIIAKDDPAGPDVEPAKPEVPRTGCNGCGGTSAALFLGLAVLTVAGRKIIK